MFIGGVCGFTDQCYVIANIPPPVVDTMVVSTGHNKLAPVSSTFSPAGELDAFPESAYSSPNSTRMSPSSPTEHTTQDADGSLGLSDQDPSSGPQRSRSASHSNSIPGSSESKEKRKRSRVTPEQLAHLERLFATDRSPTAARRKEISEMLGMQERQTQIWFQNRYSSLVIAYVQRCVLTRFALPQTSESEAARKSQRARRR